MSSKKPGNHNVNDSVYRVLLRKNFILINIGFGIEKGCNACRKCRDYKLLSINHLPKWLRINFISIFVTVYMLRIRIDIGIAIQITVAILSAFLFFLLPLCQYGMDFNKHKISIYTSCGFRILKKRQKREAKAT